MTFKSYHSGVLIRILILIICISIVTYSFFGSNYFMVAGSLALVVFLTFEFFRFLSKRMRIIEDFFESVKYRDFSRHYLEKNKSKDIQSLYEGFDIVNSVIRDINTEKETQYLYLQKILELIDIGILAFDTNDGKVLWVNDSFLNSLDFPSFKNIGFVKKRNQRLFELVFDTFYSEDITLEIPVKKESIKALVSNSKFNVGNNSYQLIVLHNIEDTLNKTESEAWKKLLSVMTHEIMNSIAPISSLAGTLKSQVDFFSKNKQLQNIDLEDLNSGLTSIEKRSEGLLKFAKTYRSLSKVTHIDKEEIQIDMLFLNLEKLLKPSEPDHVELVFDVGNTSLKIEADAYLLEQILINLILNAFEACKKEKTSKVKVFAEKKFDNQIVISVKDNGTGIPDEIKDQVFVPFFTTKKQGSGIGLSLSKQIMTLHGGKIQINSVEGKGTSVSLIFN